MGTCGTLCLLLITLILPPVGTWYVAGCGADLLINICLTILGYIPGHIHAFYLEYVYFDRRAQARAGHYTAQRAPGIYSDRVQNGGKNYGPIVQNVKPGYGTVAQNPY